MHKNFPAIFLFGLLLILFWSNYLLFKPFLVSIVLALVLSQLFQGWFKKLNQSLGNRPSVASLLMCLCIFLFLFLPFLGIGFITAGEIKDFYEKIQTENWLENISNFSSSFSLENYSDEPGQIVPTWQITPTPEKVASLQKTISDYLFVTIKIFYQSASHFIFMSFVTFFSLYYFFKDGEKFIKQIKNVSPLKDAQEEKIFANFISISRATLKGSFIIALIQGTTLGIAFWILGISSPVFWAIISAFFSLIPFVGTAGVWLPVGIFLLIEGSYYQAGAVILFGIIVVSNIDNLLRPKLVGKESGLHPLLVFFSTLGGIAIFGLSGFFIGPIITALFISVLEIYQTEFKAELARFNHPKK